MTSSQANTVPPNIIFCPYHFRPLISVATQFSQNSDIHQHFNSNDGFRRAVKSTNRSKTTLSLTKLKTNHLTKKFLKRDNKAKKKKKAAAVRKQHFIKHLSYKKIKIIHLQ